MELQVNTRDKKKLEQEITEEKRSCTRGGKERRRRRRGKEGREDVKSRKDEKKRGKGGQSVKGSSSREV